METEKAPNQSKMIYGNMVQRETDGRYAVTLLFKDDHKEVSLGNSRNKALIRLRQLGNHSRRMVN